MPWPTSTCSDQHEQDLIFAAAAALVITISLAAAGTRWWSFDDPIILRHAIAHPMAAFFFDPLVWRDLTFINLTPLLTASFRLDWLLFGFFPFAFHVHQLLLLWLVLVLLHRVLSCWLNPTGAFTALLWVALSKPLAECANFLMLRHYVEGLALALAAVLLFLRLIASEGGGSKSGLRIAILTACCVAAAAAKEIYVPLPLLLTILPVGTLGKRLKILIPTYVWLGIYPLWRRWMLGAWLGGYGTEVQPAQLFEMPSRLVAAIGIPGWVMVPALVTLLVVLLKQRRYLFLIFAVGATALAILPIVPVGGFLVPRFCLVPTILAGALLGWWFDCIASAGTWRLVRKRAGDADGRPREQPVRFGKSAALSALIVLSIQFAFTDGFQWRVALLENLRQQRVEGEFILHAGGPEDFILEPATQPQFYDGLNAFRVNILGHGDGPRAIYDPMALLNRPEVRILRYDSRLRQLQPLAPENDPTADLKRRLKPDQPLTVLIHYRFPRLEWELGPYSSGQYAVLMGDRSIGVYPVPRTGRQGALFRHDTELMVKYTAPEGWVVYSPPLKMVISEQRGELAWSSADIKQIGDQSRNPTGFIQ